MTVSSRFRRLLPDEPVLRRLAVLTLVNTVGNGLFVTSSAVFFTRSVGLSATQVGLGLTLAGGCGVAAGIPLGQLADRLGAKRMLTVLYLAQAVGLLCYTLVHSFAAFLVVACAVTMVDRGGSAVKGALYAVALPAQTRVRGRAYLRAVTNVGMGAGSAVAAAALQLDSRAGYLAMILADVVTFAIAAQLLRRVPESAPPVVGPTSTRRSGVFTDLPFLAVTALSAVQAIQFGLLDVGVPLWVVTHTHAPVAVVSVIMIVNTGLVVLFQVRAARGTDTVERAGRTARRAGLVLALSCLVFGLTQGLSPVLAIVVLLLAAVLQTAGEVLSSAASWALSYELADPAAPGSYQGLFNSGFAVAIMLAPVLTTSTAIRFGLPGWILLGVMFAASGAALVPVARWAASTRGHHGGMTTAVPIEEAS
ncbi:MAG: MFS transporter [Actinocatenispora sp.]